MTKHQCTAVRPLPVDEVMRRAFEDRLPEGLSTGLGSGYALCKLGGEHEGLHADLLWEESDNFHAVWLRWDDHDAYEFSVILDCGAVHSNGDGCSLFHEHPDEHSWNVVDPVLQALRDDITARPENYGLPPS